MLYNPMFKKQRSLKILLGVFLAVLIVPQAFGQGKTPSHVFQNAERLILEIKLIRKNQNLNTKTRDPGVQFNKLPIHVYGKGLEVFQKIADLQKKAGLNPSRVPTIPTRKITPSDVFSLVSKLNSAILKVKKTWGISKKIKQPRLIKGKVPSDAYQNLWRASFALDGLIPQLKPGHVYRNADYLMDELEIIRQKMGKSSFSSNSNAQGGDRKITPKDVLVEAYKNLYRVGKLQRKLGITPFTPPNFPIGKITPSDPFDATSMMLAELVRIKIKLKIKQNYTKRDVPPGKTPGDVLFRVVDVGSAVGQLVQ